MVPTPEKLMRQLKLFIRSLAGSIACFITAHLLSLRRNTINSFENWFEDQTIMRILFAIAIGGGLGSISRYAIAIGAEKLIPVNFPTGTLIANLSGSLLIGIFWCYFDRVHISNEFRLFLFTGFLGGFTTFSAFARETVQFLGAGKPIHALAYIFLSNIVGLSMVILGFFLCHRFFRF